MSVMAESIKTEVWSQVEIDNPSKKLKIVCYIQLFVVRGYIIMSVECIWLGFSVFGVHFFLNKGVSFRGLLFVEKIVHICCLFFTACWNSVFTGDSSRVISHISVLLLSTSRLLLPSCQKLQYHLRNHRFYKKIIRGFWGFPIWKYFIRGYFMLIIGKYQKQGTLYMIQWMDRG